METTQQSPRRSDPAAIAAALAAAVWGLSAEGEEADLRLSREMQARSGGEGLWLSQAPSRPEGGIQ